MISLKNLEQRLSNEMPGFAWSCRPANSANVLPNTQIPEEIEITAIPRGGASSGSPWRINGNMLCRWGIDATAGLICSEYPAIRELVKQALMPAWDKLAEL